MTDANGSLNICREALDRHLPQQAQRIALRFIGRNWPKESSAIQEITYAELTELSNRFANVLKNLGLKKGDVLFALSPRIPRDYSVNGNEYSL